MTKGQAMPKDRKLSLAALARTEADVIETMIFGVALKGEKRKQLVATCASLMDVGAAKAIEAACTVRVRLAAVTNGGKK